MLVFILFLDLDCGVSADCCGSQLSAVWLKFNKASPPPERLCCVPRTSSSPLIDVMALAGVYSAGNQG